MPTHTELKGLDHVGQPLLSDALEANLVTWLNWGLLGKGGFFNVEAPASGAYGGSEHRLYPVSSPYHETGQLWQAFRGDWVWETGVPCDVQPIRVSGVSVDGTFHPVTGAGPYAHTVNYPLGQVVFESAISPSSVVSCNYSHRYAQVTPADVPWWRQLQADSFRVDSDQLALQGSGAWSALAGARVQLPAVVVEVTTDTARRPTMLGGGTTVTQDVLFHVVAETPWDRRQLHDVLTYQTGKRLVLFEKGWVDQAGAFPLDENGSPVPSGKMYPDLVKATGEGGFGWRQLRYQRSSAVTQPLRNTWPYYCTTVRATFEVDMP